jgi:hypothetical protein
MNVASVVIPNTAPMTTNAPQIFIKSSQKIQVYQNLRVQSLIILQNLRY